ncbi:AsnC family transcriptional regulator, partial [Bordetella hinzii]|nr:AsnC family transcriptional regulator [Bordetella hinzii]
MEKTLHNDKPVLDAVDRRLIASLNRQARSPVAELARQVGMSAPSVTERLRRLEEQGVITGYRVELDP